MRKIAFALMVLLWTAGTTWAQQKGGIPQRICGTMEQDSIIRANNPGMESLGDFEQWMAQKRAQMSNPGGASTLGSGSIRYIPVVFHVIHEGGSENISDAQVLSQLEVLNEDFRRLNPDTVNTPSGFQPMADDMEIEFCLATVDPSGNPTTGINRVFMSGGPFSMNSMDNTVKPATIWDPNDYLNIWIADLSGGLLGYAQFPNSSGLSGLNTNNGPANTDGVVVLYTSVGRPPQNPFGGAYNRGRTATHEVGHWIGLRHIWGDGGCGADDYCNDTPLSDGANYNCPTTHVSCSSTDMVQNYMDYTDDACMNLFTGDQKSRMDVVLANSPRRASLLVSPACAGPGGVNASFTGTPTSGCAPLTVDFTDQSFGNPTSWAWDFGDGTTSTQQNPTHTYTNPGTYTVTLIVDNGTNSDTLIVADYILAQAPASLPYAEAFDAGSMPGNLAFVNGGGDGFQWAYTNTETAYGTGVGSIWFDNYSGSSGSNPGGTQDYILLPPMNFSATTNNQLSFDVAYAQYSNSYTDSLEVAVSTDCGQTFTQVYFKNGSTLATVGDQTSAWSPGNNDWRNETVSLGAFDGQPSVQVAFINRSGWGNNLYVDNINLTGVLSQPPSAGFTANTTSVCEGGTISFTDQTTGSPSAWAWDFGDGSSSTQQNPSHSYANPGTYTVTLTATNGAGNDSEVKTNYITVNANPVASLSPTHPACGQSNGSITASGSGGGGGYTYAWTGGGSGATLSNLAPGAYTVTVTDANGCSDTETVTLVDQPGPTASINSVNDASCGQSDGSATAAATGGSGGYTYSWGTNPPQSGATATNLPAGSYTVTVTDGNGCTSTAIATVSNTSGPTANISNTVHTSCGQSNGGATVTASGGSGSLTYAWSSGGNSNSISNQPAGTYTVTVTDQSGCQAVISVTIDPSTNPVASISQVNATCGMDNGSVTASATGGVGPYGYAWSNGPSSASQTGLGAGTYTVTVTDSEGCTDVQSVTLTATSAVVATASGSDVTCFGDNDGSASVTASGGTGPYTYAWSNSGTTASISNLGGGSYSVTVTDANGCTDVQTVTLTEPTALGVTVNATDESYPGANDGTASATVTGGTSPYSYAWSNGGTTASLSGLPGGVYTVTVTDANGCEQTQTLTVGVGVGIDDLPDGVTLDLFPNPNQGNFSLRYQLGQRQDLRLDLVNQLGQVVLHREVPAALKGYVDFQPDLGVGVYFLRVQCEDFISMKKVIVTR